MKTLLATALLGATLHAQAAPAFIAGAYQYLPVADGAARALPQGTLTWAFATGECGDEVWGEQKEQQKGQQVAERNVAAFVAASRPYIVSTGGAEHKFTCASKEGMERFVSRYDSKQLVGLDFDIEDGQSAEQIDALMAAIKDAQRRRPHLRYSFTVATHAAGDGSLDSLTPIGERILKAVKHHGVEDAVFNLMVMDYGPANIKVCVVKDGACDMGRSALQAARNAHVRYGIPYERIALTAMIGMNDVVSNVFSLKDARTLAEGARTMKLAGVHFWSLDRDKPCLGPLGTANPTCSGVDAPEGEFGRILSADRP
jgi:chitinase